MSDKSTELNGTYAIEYLGMIEDVAGVKEFIDGDTRKGVLAAAEKRIAALTPIPESTGEAPAVPVTAEVAEEKKPAISKQPEQKEEAKKPDEEIAKCETWRYHKTSEPRKFAKGETIPSGWNLENARLWAKDAIGAWSKIGA